jgi:hypothetical protein
MSDVGYRDIIINVVAHLSLEQILYEVIYCRANAVWNLPNPKHRIGLNLHLNKEKD